MLLTTRDLTKRWWTSRRAEEVETVLEDVAVY